MSFPAEAAGSLAGPRPRARRREFSTSATRSLARIRFPVLALLALVSALTAASVRGDSASNDLQEAADVARRVAIDMLQNPQARLLTEALDADTILIRRLGADAWSALTERQRDSLRFAVRDRFVRTLAPPRLSSADLAWSSAQPAAPNGVDVFFGLRFDGKVLKTRWVMHKSAGGWRIADVILVDPGVSLARSAEQALGRRPVERRTRGEEVWSSLFPRAAALVGLGFVVAILSVRIRPDKRILLYWTAAAPAALLGVDGFLAAQRALSEPYVVNPEPGAARWRQFEQLALVAEREGQLESARAQWARALAAGGPPASIEYEIGLASRRHGDLTHARFVLARALAEKEPAPGAAKELASIAVAAGQLAEAEPMLERYLSLAGPDPEALSLLAVVQTNLGRSDEALETIRRARALVSGEGWKGEELEAQVRARARDATGTVAALRPLEAQGLLDRSALRSDPAYLPIATEPAWVAFLNEKPKAPVPAPVPAPGR